MTDYTVHDLIMAYMEEVWLRTHPMHPVLAQSKHARFKALSDCFGIQLVEGEYNAFPDDALNEFNRQNRFRLFPDDDPRAGFNSETDKADCWRTFHRTIDSYQAVQTPFSTTMGYTGHLLPVYAPLFNEMAKSYRAEHLKLLDDLFRLMYGDIATTFTSGQLKIVGYDDANQPNELEYF